MSRLKLLTANQKLRIRDILIKRDGTVCIYCKQEIDPNNCEIDHLNDNPHDNQIYNLILCHSECNKEKRNNFDYKIIANEKLEKNKMIITVSSDIIESENSPEIEHNINVFKFVEQILSERINTDGEIWYADALNGLTYLATKKFGHCSQTTMRRHLDALTSSVAPFMIIKNDKGKKVIVKRTGN